VHSALASGVAAFLMSAVIWPAQKSYKAWKHDPARERVYRRDLFGRFVPDLWVTRVERTALVLIVALWIFGAACGWIIMHAHDPEFTPSGAMIVKTPPPQ